MEYKYNDLIARIEDVALDKTPDLWPGADRKILEAAMESHVLAKGTIMDAVKRKVGKRIYR